MDEWMGVLVALAVGLPLLGVAVLSDVRRRRRTEEELASAPLRNEPTVDSKLPHYVTQEEVDAMARPGSGAVPEAGSPHGVSLHFGHVDQDFATAGDVAELNHATVLLIGDDVLTMRELLAPLAGASPDSPLVIVAASFHKDVVATLAANRRATQLPVVAVAANPAELLQLQDVVGGHILSSTDLKSGWLPGDAMGRAALWRSDMSSTRVTGGASGKG